MSRDAEAAMRPPSTTTSAMRLTAAALIGALAPAIGIVLAAACGGKAPKPAKDAATWKPEVREGYAVTPDLSLIHI